MSKDKVLFLQLASVGLSVEQVSEQHSYELERIRALGLEADVRIVGESDKDGFIAACRGYSIVLCGGNPPLSREVVSRLDDSFLFIRYGIGINTIDTQACTEYGKLVYFMPGYCGPEIALHALALILSLLRNVGYYDRELRKGHFAKGGGPIPRRLQNLQVGLYGLGVTGIELAKILRSGFGCKLIACDPYVKAETAEPLGVKLVDFDTLLRQSDILSIHAPLTSETHHIFNREAFRKMKHNAMIINTSRGPLVDEAALCQALTDGTIGSAGLDVFEAEPVKPDNPLLALDNVVLTPHSAYNGLESTHRQYELAAEFVESFMERRILPRYTANRDVLSLWQEKGYALG